MDVTGSAQSELREQLETVLKTAAPAASAVNSPQPGWGRRLAIGLNVRITPLQVFYGLVILAGVVAKEIWDYDQRYGKPGLRISSMTGALLVAPIVYTAVQPHVAPLHDSLTLIGIGIAFQNGFFWQSVFASTESNSSN